MPELFPVKLCRNTRYLEQIPGRIFCSSNVALRRAGRRPRFFSSSMELRLLHRNLQSDPSCQIIHCLNEIHAGVLHRETDGATMSAATEAVIKLLGGTYCERGSLLAMEWAACSI